MTVDASGGVWAVGWDRNYDLPGRPVSAVVAHFDGNAWTLKSPPGPIGYNRNTLTDVAVAANGEVFAVGVAQDTSGGGIASRALMVRRQAGAWTSLAMPPGDALSRGQLQSVVTAPSGAVWAVGYYDNSGLLQPLLLQWTAGGANGTLSTHDVTPGLTVPATAWGVTATTSGTLWAVGYQSTASGLHGPLVLRGTSS